MTVAEVLEKTGTSESQILREHSVLLGLSKVSRYEAQCRRLERKYGQPLEAFRAHQNAKIGEETFVEEEDLSDWEYADAALKWWRSTLEEMRRAR